MKYELVDIMCWRKRENKFGWEDTYCWPMVFWHV